MHTNMYTVCIIICVHISDAVTIVLFQVLGAFANRPLDPLIEDHERDITVADVSSCLYIHVVPYTVVHDHDHVHLNCSFISCSTLLCMLLSVFHEVYMYLYIHVYIHSLYMIPTPEPY